MALFPGISVYRPAGIDALSLTDAAPSYKYMPALDGIRAVSILIVIISHYGLADLVPGGMGVNIFFFISGLLISRQLSVELSEHGRIAFHKFYLRRFARLLPALLVMIPIGGALYVAMGKPLTVGDVFSALLYITNYYGYFVGYAQPDPAVPHPFIILWSLAVEEHFYLLFPLLIAALFRRPRIYIAVLAGLLVAVPLWRLHLYDVCGADLAGHPLCGHNPSQRIYGGTDTRADALLYGVLLTELLRHQGWRRYMTWLSGLLPFAVGIALLLASLLIRGEEFRDVHRYTVQSLGLVPIVVSLVFTRRFPRLRRVLECRPAILIGRWSYSLYLYHWVAMIVAGGLNPVEFSWAWYATAVPLCLGLSLLSYYMVEMPVVGLRRRLGSHVATQQAMPSGSEPSALGGLAVGE